MKSLLDSVWLWLITVMLLLYDASTITGLTQNTQNVTNISKSENNYTKNHEKLLKNKTPGKIYLGKGVYLYKINGTNSTKEWKVKDTDVPKLFRLSFPAADPQDSNANSANSNDNTKSTSTIDGIHPWILGLAAFVGCLLIVVVLTVMVLARRWMVKTWQMRNFHNGSVNGDLDNIVVEADPEAPKLPGNNLLPHPHRNHSLSLIAPGLVSEPTNYVHSHTVPNQYYNYRQSSPQILSSDNLLPMPEIRPAPELTTTGTCEENLQCDGTHLACSQAFYNNNSRRTFQFACDQDLTMSHNTDGYLHCISNENLYTTDEQRLEFQQQQHLRSICYSRKQNSECDENHEYGYSHEIDNYDLASIAQHQTATGLQVKHSSHKCDISVIFCDAASSSQLHNNSREKQIFSSDASAGISAFVPVESENMGTFNRDSIKIDGYIPSLPCITGTSCYDDDKLGQIWSNKPLETDTSCDTDFSPAQSDTALH